MYRVELSKRAMRDLRRIDHGPRKRLLALLERELAAEPQPPNLDVKALVGRTPWLRLRRGEYRVVYRPLTGPELRALRAAEAAGFLVERIVDRRDLEKAAATLPS
jgi:mRNA-degrading endonuclease RelE of RelBE toxin-antitoxin system